jgi:broad specificity phosphatase PhoE
MTRQVVPEKGVGNGTVLLVRHGPVTQAWKGTLYGHSDAEPISLEGVRWTGPAVDEVASSDLKRARYTAAMLFPGRPVREEPGLRETCYGSLEGRDLLELHQEQPTLWDRWLAEPDRFRFPQGETHDEVRERVVSCVEAIRQDNPDGTIAVVTHGGAIRSYVAWVLGATAHGVGRLRCSPLNFVEVRYWDGVPVIERTNMVGGVLAGPEISSR